MAASNEARLISKIVRDREILPVLAVGVADDWFVDETDRAVFRFLCRHYEKYAEVPTAVTLKDNFPTYRLLDVQDSLDYLLDQFVAHRRATKTYLMVQRAVELVQNPHDYPKVLEHLRSGLTDLDVEHSQASTDVELTEDPMARLAAYRALSAGSTGLLGLPTGFPTIDRATAGLQRGQLVTIVAPPKAGKSQLALRVAATVHLGGHRPLYQSFEMSNYEQTQRFDALVAGISHNRLRRGLLTDEEEQRYEQALKDLEGKHSFLLADSTSGLTVSQLGAKIEVVQPDIAFVDGVYLMMDEVTGEANTPQALTNITRSFKRLAQRLNIPIVITTQTLLWKMKKQAISQNSIGYSSSFLQDSDVVLGLERMESEDDQHLRKLKIVASRNCGPAEAELLWDWAEGRFEELRTISADEDAEDEDAEGFTEYAGVG